MALTPALLMQAVQGRWYRCNPYSRNGRFPVQAWPWALVRAPHHEGWTAGTREAVVPQPRNGVIFPVEPALSTTPRTLTIDGEHFVAVD